MAENLNIYQKLAKIRKPVEVIKKNRKGYGYTYVDEEEILSKITGSMGKYGVSLIPSITHGTSQVEPYHYVKTKTTKDASQGFGSALTYASRYFLLKYFNVATSDDDPDEYRRRQREAEEEENRLVSEKLVEQIHQMVLDYLGAHPDEKQKIATITKKYVKENGKPSNNYFAIRDPSVAKELMNALETEFSK